MPLIADYNPPPWLQRAAFIAAGMFCLCYAWRPLPAYLWPEMFGPEYVRLVVGNPGDVGLMLRWLYLEIPLLSAAGITLILKGISR